MMCSLSARLPGAALVSRTNTFSKLETNKVDSERLRTRNERRYIQHILSQAVLFCVIICPKWSGVKPITVIRWHQPCCSYPRSSTLWANSSRCEGKLSESLCRHYASADTRLIIPVMAYSLLSLTIRALVMYFPGSGTNAVVCGSHLFNHQRHRLALPCPSQGYTCI